MAQSHRLIGAVVFTPNPFCGQRASVSQTVLLCLFPSTDSDKGDPALLAGDAPAAGQSGDSERFAWGCSWPACFSLSQSVGFK